MLGIPAPPTLICIKMYISNLFSGWKHSLPYFLWISICHDGSWCHNGHDGYLFIYLSTRTQLANVPSAHPGRELMWEGPHSNLHSPHENINSTKMWPQRKPTRLSLQLRNWHSIILSQHNRSLNNATTINQLCWLVPEERYLSRSVAGLGRVLTHHRSSALVSCPWTSTSPLCERFEYGEAAASSKRQNNDNSPAIN